MSTPTKPCAFRDCGDPACHLCRLARTSPPPLKDIPRKPAPKRKGDPR